VPIRSLTLPSNYFEILISFIVFQYDLRVKNAHKIKVGCTF